MAGTTGLEPATSAVTVQYSPAPRNLTFRQATCYCNSLGFGIFEKPGLRYVERRWIQARACAFTVIWRILKDLQVESLKVYGGETGNLPFSLRLL
jgi:hypothetical protein